MSKSFAILASVASSIALVCWVIMFLAGNDMWHDVGRPDFWKLQGPPYADMRVFAFSFYLQFIVLLTTALGAAWLALRKARTCSPQEGERP